MNQEHRRRDHRLIANMVAIGVVLLPIALVLASMLAAKGRESYCTPQSVYQLRPAFGPAPGLTPPAISLPCDHP